jgi:hypothetical protein
VFPNLSKGLSLLQDLLKFLSMYSEKKIDRVAMIYDTRIRLVTLMSILSYSQIAPHRVLSKHWNNYSLCFFGVLGQLTSLPARILLHAPS